MSVAVIAERAGVSVATVSRVLNNSARVNPETARIVREVVRELNYDQLKVRRGPRLRGQPLLQSQTLGVIAVGKSADQLLRQSVYSSTIASFMQAAGNRGMRVMMDALTDPSAVCAAVRDRVVNGAIILVHSQADPDLVRSLSRLIPVVRVLGEEFAYPEIDHIRPDHMAIGHVAHDYLASRGCRRMICVVTQPESQMVLVRSFGFLISTSSSDQVLSEIFTVGETLGGSLRGIPSRRFESLGQVADEICQSNVGPCGLFLSTDVDALSLYPLLEQRGIVLNRDVHLVVGKNGNLNFPENAVQRPATIELGGEEIGKTAVDRLIHRIKNPTQSSIRILVAPRVTPPAKTSHSK